MFRYTYQWSSEVVGDGFRLSKLRPTGARLFDWLDTYNRIVCSKAVGTPAHLLAIGKNQGERSANLPPPCGTPPIATMLDDAAFAGDGCPAVCLPQGG